MSPLTALKGGYVDKAHKHRVGELKSIGYSAEDIFNEWVATKDAAGISLEDVEAAFGPKLAVAKKTKKAKKK
jgi:hypothetical protein